MSQTKLAIQCFLEYAAFMEQLPGKAHEYVNFAAFAAETERVNNAQLIEKQNRAAGKIFRAAQRIADGQLQHHIRSVSQRTFSAQIFIHHGRCAALDKITAHDDDTVVCARKLFCLFDVIGVSVMERIVFRNNADCFHRFSVSPEATYFPRFQCITMRRICIVFSYKQFIFKWF